MDVRFCFGLLFLCFQLCEMNGSNVTTDPQGAIETECRDRYFWVSIDVGFAGHVPRFEAVVENGVHIISEAHASMCGYTLNNLNGRASLRASYFSCYTENKNDSNFIFKLNVVLTDHTGRENKHSLTENCTLPVDWSSKEILCEENYIEVTVARDTPCRSDKYNTSWPAALAFAQRSAISEWQIMFLNQDFQSLDAMSISDARRMGYMLDSTPNRVVFRSAYNQTHSAITEIDGIAVEVIHATVFFRRKWAVVMLDTSAACTIAPSSFDGVILHWRTPKVMTPLVQDFSRFVSRSIELGAHAQLLDEATRKTMGYVLGEDGQVVHVSMPFGAPGGYRMSLVENNVYKESYKAFLCYEHIYSHVFTDDTEIQTRHRQLRVMETPLVPRIPFAIDETLPHEEVFTVYLGSFASDVELIAIKLNENYLSVTDAIQQHYFITKIPHTNGTHGFIIKVPFEDKSVNKVYLGEGLLQYSVEINYTLNIIKQSDSFFHHVSVVAHVNDAFPPDVSAFCTAQSIIFRINHPKKAGLWEVCVGHQALTSDLSRQEGYILKNDSQSMTLEVPLFTSGYIYEDITLRNFVGSFEILIRDSKTLEIHKRITKHCYFQSEELTVCSTDGMMTVVATTTKTWPAVPPSSTTLLDRSCRPKATDETRVLFSFGVDTCGTRLMFGEGYIVYENEVISDGGVIIDQESAITRESKFRLTVRCFYALDSVKKVFTSRLFEGPGFGTVNITDTTDVNGLRGNLMSSHAASVFDPKPYEPGRGCCSTDEVGTRFLQRELPHRTDPSSNQGRKTSEHSYHASNIPDPHRHDQLLKQSGVQFNPQTIIKHSSGPSMTPAAGQQSSFDGLFKDYKSSLDDAPQKTPMKRSGQNQDNSVMIGDDSSASAFYRGSKNALLVINETLPSILYSLIAISNPTNYNPNSNELSDQLFLKGYMDSYTPYGDFQHSPDPFNELINNPSTKDSSLYTENIISKKLESSESEQGQKHLESHILATESSAQPLKEHGLEKVGLLNVVGEHSNFMHEDDDDNSKKLAFLQTQQQKEADDGRFPSDPKLLAVKPSYDKLRGTLFFPGSRSRYGSSIHKGIITG
uniref:ZP domain-containing protein n=1 Tax=Cyprinus carpio TaxID=7962 RepID=A0A8C2GU16_CYPCA